MRFLVQTGNENSAMLLKKIGEEVGAKRITSGYY